MFVAKWYLVPQVSHVTSRCEKPILPPGTRLYSRPPQFGHQRGGEGGSLMQVNIPPLASLPNTGAGVRALAGPSSSARKPPDEHRVEPQEDHAHCNCDQDYRRLPTMAAVSREVEAGHDGRQKPEAEYDEHYKNDASQPGPTLDALQGALRNTRPGRG
jgi:hypothetical protein